MESRSCGPTPELSRRPVHATPRPPRFSAATDTHDLVTVDVIKGPSGFGFTLSDTEHGQIIKQVVDSERCRDVFPGDVLVAINDTTVLQWSHEDVVNFLRRCRPRRVATFTLMTTRHKDARRDPPVRRAMAVHCRPASALASPLSADGQTDSSRLVDYNQLYRRMYSPVPFVRHSTSETTQPRQGVNTSNGKPDVVHTSRYSAPPTLDIVGGSPAPRRFGHAQRREPRRSLPTQPAAYVDLLSPLASRRTSRGSSQSSLNFSGTPDFIPASAYLENDDRRRRASGRPSADEELAALTLNDAAAWSRGDDMLSSSTTNSANRDDSFQSHETDDASVPSSGSLRNGTASGLPTASPSTPGYHDRLAPAALIGAGSESCNGYNARTATVHSAAPVRHHPPSGHRKRSQSALADAVKPGRGTHRGPEVRLSADGDYERPVVAMTAKGGSLDRRDIRGSEALSRVVELAEPTEEQHHVPVVALSSDINGDSADVARSTHDRRATSSSSAVVYEVELHRGSRGFGFAIRGGSEFSGMPICVLNIASGGSADRDGRLRNEDEIVTINGVPTDGMTHSAAVQLIQNSPSPLHLLMRLTTHVQSPDQQLNHNTGRVPRRYARSPMKVARQAAAASPTRANPTAVSTPPVFRRPTAAS